MRSYLLIIILSFLPFSLLAQEATIEMRLSDAGNLAFTWQSNGAAPDAVKISAGNTVLFEDSIHNATQLENYILFLLDTSNSMNRPFRQGIKAYLKNTLQQLPTGYQVALATFDDSLRVINSFTDSDSLLSSQVDEITTGRKRTELFGWLVKSIDHFPARTDINKIVVVFSDGKTTDIAYDHAAVVAKAKAAQVSIFSAAYLNLPEDQYLRRLSDDTGGYFERASSSHALADRFNEQLFASARYQGSSSVDLTKTDGSLDGEQTITYALTFPDGSVQSENFTHTFEAAQPPAWLGIGGGALLLALLLLFWFMRKRKQTEAPASDGEEAPAVDFSCPACDATLPPNATQCPKCGSPIDADLSALAWLEEAKGNTHPIKTTSCKIGALGNNEIVLNYEKISRNHAIIDFKDGRFILTDRNSANGTFVNDKRVNSTELNHEDIVRFANLHFQFLINPLIKRS